MSIAAPTLVADPDDVTAEWLTSVLVHAGALTDGRVVSFDTDQIGTGQVGANFRYRLAYEGETGPATVVAKFASRDETSRAAGIATLTYETEVAFYRDVADSVDVSRPRCYFVAIEHGTADVVLVLEDLAPAEQGDQVAGCTLEQAGIAMDEAARLHGPRWGDKTLLDLPWLAERAPAASGGYDQLYQMMFPTFLERYRDTLDPPAVVAGEQLGDRIAGWVAHQPAALTVTHNDYRLDNMLFGTAEGGRPLAVVDWQTVRLGCGTADVAYFLGTGLAVEERRAHERDLVARYHQGLLAYGVDGYPLDACWEDYRRYSYSGYFMAVIASILVGRTDRGDAMFMAMANRSAALAADVDADEVL